MISIRMTTRAMGVVGLVMTSFLHTIPAIGLRIANPQVSRIATRRVITRVAYVQGFVEFLYTCPVHQAVNHLVFPVDDDLAVVQGVSGALPFPTAGRGYLAFGDHSRDQLSRR
jgi:hypothetical protein